MQSEIGIALYR